MGCGITQVIATSKINVIQFDVNEAMLAKSKATIEINLQKLLTKGKINEHEKNEALGRIQFTASAKDCIADVIIEAIVEDKMIKQNLFDKLALVNNDETIFATNTSSIFVSELCKDKAYATRFNETCRNYKNR